MRYMHYNNTLVYGSLAEYIARYRYDTYDFGHVPDNSKSQIAPRESNAYCGFSHTALSYQMLQSFYVLGRKT